MQPKNTSSSSPESCFVISDMKRQRTGVTPEERFDQLARPSFETHRAYNDVQRLRARAVPTADLDKALGLLAELVAADEQQERTA